MIKNLQMRSNFGFFVLGISTIIFVAVFVIYGTPYWSKIPEVINGCADSAVRFLVRCITE